MLYLALNGQCAWFSAFQGVTVAVVLPDAVPGLKKYSIEGHGCLNHELTIASRFLQDFLKIFRSALGPAAMHRVQQPFRLPPL
jgi:hypothetical protein